jgi:hypothetical protein
MDMTTIDGDGHQILLVCQSRFFVLQINLLDTVQKIEPLVYRKLDPVYQVSMYEL